MKCETAAETSMESGSLAVCISLTLMSSDAEEAFPDEYGQPNYGEEFSRTNFWDYRRGTLWDKRQQKSLLIMLNFSIPLVERAFAERFTEKVDCYFWS